MGVRDQAKAETREALLEAALQSFHDDGLDVSLDAICRRAGYTRGAFYVHFQDREALLRAVVEHVIGRYTAVVEETADAGRDLEAAIDRFTAGFMMMLGGTGVEAHWAPLPAFTGFQVVMAACSRSPAVRARFVELLEDACQRVARAAAAGQRAGNVRADLDADGAARLLVTLVLGLIGSAWLGLPIDPRVARRQIRLIMAP
jgi:TetR/AcrR family transcriptional repressor of nem operon